MKVTQRITLIAGAATGVVSFVALSLPGRAFETGVPISFVTVGLLSLISMVVVGGVVFPFALVGDQMFDVLSQRLSGSTSVRYPAGLFASWCQAFINRCETAVHDRISREKELSSSLKEAEIRQHVAEAERDHLEGVIHALRDAVIVTDAFDEVVLANDSASQLFEVPSDKVLAHQVSEIVSDEQIIRLIQDTRESGNLSSRRLVEHELQKPSERCVLEISLSCVPHQSNKSGGVVTILHDVTRERQISEMKTDFVSKASHELRTPLSLIKAYIEMLIDGEAETEDTQKEFYGIIQTEANRLERLINNMLNISRIEAGISQGEWREMDLKEIIDEVCELAKPGAGDKNITITHKQSQLCTIAEIDRDMIQQVIMNLVSNAIKYTPEGGRITISTAPTDCDRSVMVSVADTGLGIPPDAVPQLFDKFYRVSNYNRVAPGTGLGLNLVKQVVERVHGGEVGVESELGMGSRFWFTVPCKRPS